jgi:hypothetical protein
MTRDSDPTLSAAVNADSTAAFENRPANRHPGASLACAGMTIS